MKRAALAAGMFVSWLILVLPAFAEVTGTARLSLLQGDVIVQTADTGAEWVAASINMPLMPGDKIWVPEGGRAEIQFLGGTYLRADGNTEMDITNLRTGGEDNIIQLGLPQGRAYVQYRRLPAGNSVCQIDTPLTSAVAYGTGEFDVAAYDNGYTEVSVLDGVVYAESKDGNTKVGRGSMVSVGTDNYAELSPLRPADDWLRWNFSRDSQFARARESSRYLPPSLDSYGRDFDEYGRWVHTSDYGYVWTPKVAVSGWAPYRSGRWVWTGGDYVWVSYEPWGWAPYHYGRWSHRSGIGWFWVPPAVNAVFWSPGFVAWIQTPTYVSWVPLAPRETYYGHGHYGPHSVNVNKLNIKTMNITNVYVNARVNNAVTLVHRDTFLTGKHARIVNAPANPFSGKVKVSPGRPDIRPVKATYAPIPAKTVPKRALPSRQVLEKRKVWGIDKRPVAVKENVSVFTGKPVSSMPVRKIEKPKSSAEVRKADMKRYPLQKETKPMPQAMPKERSAKPVVKEKEKGKPEVQREMHERPAIQPKESVEKPPTKRKETTWPSKGVAKEPSTAPDGSVKIPEQKRKLAQSPTERKMSERPTVVPRENTGEPQMKQRQEGKLRPQKEFNERPKTKSLEKSEGGPHTKEQMKKQKKTGEPQEVQTNRQQF
jgi:hypothetical protein